MFALGQKLILEGLQLQLEFFLIDLFVFSQNRAISRNLNQRKMQINFQTISDINFLPLNLFPFKVNSPQVKRKLKPSIKKFVYELPHD